MEQAHGFYGEVSFSEIGVVLLHERQILGNLNKKSSSTVHHKVEWDRNVGEGVGFVIMLHYPLWKGRVLQVVWMVLHQVLLYCTDKHLRET